MRTIIIAMMVLGMASTTAMATPNHGFIRDLTIETMLNYAKELYQRGDLKESRNVMARIKQLNPDYLEQPKVDKKIALQANIPAATPLKVQSKPIEIVAVAYDPNADLREAIAQEDQILKDLNRDVDALRTQIQATHHE